MAMNSTLTKISILNATTSTTEKMGNGKQLHITSEEATGDRLNDRIRSIEYVRAGERIHAAFARPRGTPRWFRPLSRGKRNPQ